MHQQSVIWQGPQDVHCGKCVNLYKQSQDSGVRYEKALNLQRSQLCYTSGSQTHVQFPNRLILFSILVTEEGLAIREWNSLANDSEWYRTVCGPREIK